VRLSLRLVVLAVAALLAGAAEKQQQQPLTAILSSELERNLAGLKKADPAAYFISYEVTEQDSRAISASAGAIESSNANRVRLLDVSVRVGSPKLDNYHAVRGERPQFTSGMMIPLDDEPKAIQQRVWLETDRAYRAAAQRLISITTNKELQVAAEDGSDDFSREEKAVYSGTAPPLRFNAEEWTSRLRKWSADLSGRKGVLNGRVIVLAEHETRWLVNSEGTSIEQGRNFARIMIMARGKASDGMDLATTANFEATDPSRLPKDARVGEAIDRVAAHLAGLLDAPVAEPFVGPAILSGRAAGVLFHEIFGHRIEGHRQKDESEGQTFTKMINTAVLPDFLSVVFDPTRKEAAGTDLNGFYVYDDEGVKARPVPLVENGVLKTFLLSRSPVKGFDRSNGHGRRQAGYEVVSRQSNLIVESSRAVPEGKLREMLMAEVKRQNKPYGLYFEEITGGFTNTGRRGIQAFKVIPLVVYRVYADGRPDELIRGADIVGTPLASFGRILATGDKAEVFNGYCGAESGSVPVAAVSPALLISELEIEKKEKAQDRPPLLPRPMAPSGGGGQ
jgi:TldD protein